MTTDNTLWEMEKRFWTQGADAARHMTAKDAVFVYPYPAWRYALARGICGATLAFGRDV